MAQVIVRNIEEEVIAVFRERARNTGRSLEEELRRALRDAARATPAELVELSRRIRELSPPQPDVDTTALIREDRDADEARR